MSLCKSGQILNCCHPNALLTLAEYLTDYATEETRKEGWQMIGEELLKIPNPKAVETVKAHLAQIRDGSGRDFRF